MQVFLCFGGKHKALIDKLLKQYVWNSTTIFYKKTIKPFKKEALSTIYVLYNRYLYQLIRYQSGLIRVFKIIHASLEG